MNTRQDWMVNMLGGVVPEQQQQSLSATGQQFAARFEQLLWPLEELVAEWKGTAQASPEVARTTLSLLSNNSYITETRLAVIQDVLLPAMPATESQSYLALPPAHAPQQYPTPQTMQDPFLPPCTSTPPPLPCPTVQQQPRLDLATVDPTSPSVFTSILAETEKFSSTRDLDLLFGIPQHPSSSGMGYLPCDWSTPPPSFAPLAHITSPPSIFAPPSPPTPLPLPPNPGPLAHLPKNHTTTHLLLWTPAPPSFGSKVTPCVQLYEVTLLEETFNSEEGRVLSFRVPDARPRGVPEVVRAVYEAGGGEVRMKVVPWSLAARKEEEGAKWNELVVLQLEPGSFTLVEAEQAKRKVEIGSAEWWRGQVCIGRHKLSPSRTCWTALHDVQDPRITTVRRRYRIIAHFAQCAEGDISVGMAELARACGGGAGGR